jgi:hypothetical protein
VQSATQTVRVGLQLHSATNRVIFNYTFAQALSHLREPFPILEQWIALTGAEAKALIARKTMEVRARTRQVGKPGG